MRGPPPPVPVTEHARDRRGQAPPLRRGPRSPAGFQLPQKPSPHRGEGVAARAVTDEGSSFPRTSHRACQRQAGTSPAPAQRPKTSRRLPAAPKAFPPEGRRWRGARRGGWGVLLPPSHPQDMPEAGAQSAPLRRDRKRPCPQLPPPSCTPAYNPAPPHDNI